MRTRDLVIALFTPLSEYYNSLCILLGPQLLILKRSIEIRTDENVKFYAERIQIRREVFNHGGDS